MAARGGASRDAAYVQDIVDSCKAIERYAQGKSLEDFRADPMLQDAVARRLFVIGEAAKSVSESFRLTRPTIDWKNMGRLRDRVGHHDWSIEIEKVWDLVVQNVPALRKELEHDPVLGA